MKQSRAICYGFLASMLLTTGAAVAQSNLVYNKWNIELEGQAVKAGDIVFRVTPRQGDPTDITVNVTPGRDEAKVVKDVRDALAAKLSPDRYIIEMHRIMVNTAGE